MEIHTGLAFYVDQFVSQLYRSQTNFVAQLICGLQSLLHGWIQKAIAGHASARGHCYLPVVHQGEFIGRHLAVIDGVQKERPEIRIQRIFVGIVLADRVVVTQEGRGPEVVADELLPRIAQGFQDPDQLLHLLFTVWRESFQGVSFLCFWTQSEECAHRFFLVLVEHFLNLRTSVEVQSFEV